MGSLQRIKEHSGKWFVKALLWILVASFALWGIGDMVVNYSKMRPIAKVGGQGISQEEFHMALQRTIRGLQQSSKTHMSGDEIRKAGIPTLVMDNLLNQAAIREEISHLGLVASDELVRRIIQSDPMFHNEKGEYDGRALVAILQQSGISESQFVHDVRLRALQNQLMMSLASGASLPKNYTELLYKSIEQKRVLAVVTVPTDKMPKPSAPSTQELQGYYDAHKAQFSYPEVRTLAVLELDVEKLKSAIKLPEETILAAFESRKEEFSLPEKREIEELTFSDEISAKLAFEELSHLSSKEKAKPAGKNAKKAKKTGKKSEKNTEKEANTASEIAAKYKGNYRMYAAASKADLPDEFAQEAFTAPVNKVQLSNATAIGHRVFYVKSVTAAKPAILAEARKQIENDLKTQQINDTVLEIRNKVEDALAGGAPYEEIAAAQSMKVFTFESVTKEGKSLDGKVVIPDSLKPIILEQAFSVAEKADSSLIEGKDGGFYFVRAVKVTSSFVPEFATIKEKITTAWEEEERAEAALALAESISNQAKSAAELKALAKTHKLTVTVMEPLSFSSVAKDKIQFKSFPSSLLNKVFALKEGRSSFAPIVGASGAQVVFVQTIEPFNLKQSKDGYKKFSENLTKTAQRDIMDLYTKYLKEKLGVTINNSIYQGMVGAL